MPLPAWKHSGPICRSFGPTYPKEGPEYSCCTLRILVEAPRPPPLIRHRYDWEEQRIIALAPLMFVLLVERCIGWQRQRLANLETLLDRFDKQVSSRLKATISSDDALKDISIGEDKPLPEHFYRTFGEYLGTLAKEVPDGVAEPMVTELWGGPQGRICRKYLDRLTGGSKLARWTLEYGDVRLDDIPEELLSVEATGERVRWLESHLSEEAKAMLRERSNRNLPIGERSIERWN